MIPHASYGSSNSGSTATSSPLELAIKSELGMQSTLLSDDVRERVEASVEQLRGRATVGDVAAAAGLRLSEAETALKALAFDSEADLQVT